MGFAETRLMEAIHRGIPKSRLLAVCFRVNNIKQYERLCPLPRNDDTRSMGRLSRLTAVACSFRGAHHEAQCW